MKVSEISEKDKLNLSILNSAHLEVRDYQLKIANECADKNSLVVLPTGLGKTIIAVLIASKILEKVPQNSKIIILAPTRPLINQHYETFLKFLKIPEEKLAILTGKIAPENRVDIFNAKQILFYTPQTLRNDLVSRKYTLKDTALIIFDEAHHTSGDYPYTMIADEYLDHNPDSVILALTASPGASKKKITELCENLHIPIKNIHIRTRKDSDVKNYLKAMDIYKIGVKLTPFMSEAYDMINIVLEERLHYLSQLNFLEVQGEILHTKVIRKDLLRLNTELVRKVKGDGDKTGVYKALSINAQALILFHMLELVEQQGLDVLLEYLEKLNREAKKRGSSKANKILAADSRVRKLFIELKKNHEFSPDNLVHPKFQILVKVLLEELRNNKNARILVFVKLRNSVRNIVNNLKDIDIIKPIRFVGQATKSQDDKGLSQKRQIEILNQFKQGLYNVLVSTNVGEEGLDIAECDLVVFFDVVASEIRLIQRKGRTARHRQGKVVILYCKETHDEIYLRIALSKLKRMNVTLKNPRQLQDSYSQPAEELSIQKFDIADQSQRKQKNNLHQTRLQGFLNVDHREKKEDAGVDVDNSTVKIGKFLPMKFGIRKRFLNENITYTVTDTDLHIIIHNKVLIQIIDPKAVNFDNLLIEIEDLEQICSLLIVIFDFVDFIKDIDGEKRILKRRIQALGKKTNHQFISIDNEEELFFIVKNIIFNPKNKG